MKSEKDMYRKFLINLTGIGLFALLLFNLPILNLTSLASLRPEHKNVDFESSDFYNLIADAREERALDDKVVIVPIDELSRQEIVSLIDDIYLCGPNAIGLDVFFQFPMSGDDRLVEVLKNTPSLITPMGVTKQEDGAWQVIPAYALDSMNIDRRGVVNMNIARQYSVVRTFKPFYATDRGDVAHFAVALARLAEGAVVDNLHDKYGDTSIAISYPAREYNVIAPDDILERADDIKGKIVLLGALNEMQDMHITPVDDAMPGVLIHAHALSTILNGSYLSFMPEWGLWLLGLIICVLMVTANMWFERFTGGKLLMRLFQVAMTLLIVYVGCVLYIRFNFVLELALPLMIITLGLAALDIWTETLKLMKKIFQKKSSLLKRFFLVTFLLCNVCAIKGASYSVFRYTGDVKIKTYEGWKDVGNNMVVFARDQFLLGEHARLGIVDNDTQRIYYTTKSGTQNVAQIVSNARKQSDRIASTMWKQIQNGGSKSKSLTILGAVNRGNGETDFTEVLYSEIYRMQNICETNDSTPISAEIEKDADCYYFVVKNRSEQALCVNIIRMSDNTSQKPQLCLEIGYSENQPYLVVAPQSTVALRDFPFLDDSVSHRYLLVATLRPFDCQLLKMLLSNYKKPEKSVTLQGEKTYFQLIK